MALEDDRITSARAKQRNHFLGLDLKKPAQLKAVTKTKEGWANERRIHTS